MKDNISQYTSQPPQSLFTYESPLSYDPSRQNQQVPITPSPHALRPDFAQNGDFPIEHAHRPSQSRHNAEAAVGNEMRDQPLPSDGACCPTVSHPTLRLSGRIISATFTIPYSVKFGPSLVWDLSPRPGNSALYDSFAYLASNKSPWNHTLVGWTGEILSVSTSLNTTSTCPRSSGQVTAEFGSRAQKYAIKSTEITSSDRFSLEKQLERNEGGKIVPVWLTDKASENIDVLEVGDQSRWRRFADKELYTLFHYKPSEPAEGPKVKQAWADYRRMNELFAERIFEIYTPGDIVIVHDYNLMLLPSLLRQKVPHIYLGFFLHIPFPSSEFFRCVAKRNEILSGVLGADMIGFQATSYSQHFSSCCTRLLHVPSAQTGLNINGKLVAVEAFPIGVDAPSCESFAFTDSTVAEKLTDIRKLYAGKSVIISRDNINTASGIAQKLQAFEIFLERYPEWRDKAVLIQITSPIETNLDMSDGETTITDKIPDLVSKINRLYGSISFSPVQHFLQHLDKAEYFALMRLADVGLMTSVRDGMNTTCLEYIVCQKENHSPLIVSEFSGISSCLTGAIKINPWDLSQVADAINRALLMSPEDKKLQHERLYQHVVTNDIQTWTDRYINALLYNLEVSARRFTTPVLTPTVLLKSYSQAKNRLLLFDYDGTLTPIVENAAAALPTPKLKCILKALVSDPGNAVWIISGRDQTFLNAILGDITELGLSAEHGCFMRFPKGKKWVDCAEDKDTCMVWQGKISNVFNKYTEMTPGSFLETKRVALTWHYRLAEVAHGVAMEKACHAELEDAILKGGWEVKVMRGKMNLEVRPRSVNKGFIAKKLLAGYEVNMDLGIVLCIGDDGTDEDMFRALKLSKLPTEKVFSVSIGPSEKQTLATWHLEEPEDVVALLGSLS